MSENQAPTPPQQPAYPAAPYPSAPGYTAPAPAKTNTLAIVSLVAAIAGVTVVTFIGSIVAVITGHMALSQLKTSGEQGRGMALAGTIVGWVGIGLGIVMIVLAIAFFGWIVSSYPTSSLS